MFEAFRRYADFSGRSRRREFWLFILFQWLVYIGAFVLLFGALGVLGTFEAGRASDADVAAAGIGGLVLIGLLVIFWLVTLVPNLAVAARRMQDQDIPGWVGVILVIGGWLFKLPLLVMAVFGCIPGTRGTNKFGADPKADHAADIFS